MDSEKEIYALIQKELSLSDDAPADEKALLEVISNRVIQLMHEDIGLLLSYLYRLDVKEAKVDYILNKQVVIPAHMGIAQLILDRQKQRVLTKKTYDQGDMIEGWEF